MNGDKCGEGKLYWCFSEDEEEGGNFVFVTDGLFKVYPLIFL